MRKRSILAPLCAATILPAVVWAQAAPNEAAETTDGTSETSKSKEEDVVVLSPFEVVTDTDSGYKATNAVSGTRLNIAIKDVPLNLEVITAEFLRDTGATSLREGLRYSSGVVLESQADAFAEDDGNPQSAGANDPRGVTRRAGDSTTKMRGFVIDQVLRDGFRRQYSADWINIGRVEVVRGPSALLYGVGSFGGVINYLPKMPEQTAQYYFGTSVGSFGYYRGEFDVTGPLGDSSWKPAFRLTGSYQERGDQTDYFKERHWTLAPVFTFKPFPNTTITLDNEFGYSEQEGVGFQNIRSNIGNQAASPSRTAEWLTDSSGGIINNRTFRWSGPDTYLKGPFRNNLVDVTQKIGENLYVKVGAAQSEATFDSRQVSAGVSPGTFSISNPDAYYANGTTTLDGATLGIQDAIRGALADPTGKYAGVWSTTDIYNARSINSYRADRLYGFVSEGLFNNIGSTVGPTTNDQSEIWYQWSDYNRVERRDQVRAEVTYLADLGKWGRHTFLGGVQYMHLRSREEQFGSKYSYTNKTTGEIVSVRDYQRYNFKNPSDYSPFRYGVQGDGLPDVDMVHLYDYDKQTWDLGYYGVYQGQFFNDRVTVIGGGRWDRSDARTVQTYVYEQGHDPSITGPGSEGTIGKAPTATSPQIGIDVRITKGLSVFGVYSTGVVPNPYAADGNGNMMAPTKAKNREVGIKFDLLDGRVSGTVSAYEIKRTGQPKYVWWAPNPYASKQAGWDETKPNAVLGSFATPDAMWAVIHSTEGKSVAEGTSLAKQIWSQGWWPLLDELATVDDRANAYNGAEGSQFWNWSNAGYAYSANTITSNYDPSVTGNDYFQNIWYPLFNLSDPEVVKAFNAIMELPGWKGNYYTDQGNTYRWADGTAGYTNGPGGNGAYVPMDDLARGWDASVILTPTDWLQLIVNYAHVNRRVTSKTYQFVSLGYWPAGWWMQKDQNFGTLSQTRTPEEAYEDINDSSTYRVIVPDYNQSMDDTPENTASVWARVSLEKVVPLFKGFTIGLGGQWEDKRMWFSGFSGGGGNVALKPGTTDATDPDALVKFYTDPRLTVNGMIEYRTRLNDKYDLRLALNVDNILDDQSRYGLWYAPGRYVKFSTGVSF